MPLKNSAEFVSRKEHRTSGSSVLDSRSRNFHNCSSESAAPVAQMGRQSFSPLGVNNRLIRRRQRDSPAIQLVCGISRNDVPMNGTNIFPQSKSFLISTQLFFRTIGSIEIFLSVGVNFFNRILNKLSVNLRTLVTLSTTL